MVQENVWGKVLGSNGMPIRDARVEIVRTDSIASSDLIWSLTTNSKGQFCATGSEACHYRSAEPSRSEAALKNFTLLSFNVLKQGRKHHGEIEQGLIDAPIEITCPWIESENHEAVVRYMCFGL